jgi:hypothetical protein
MKYLTEDEKQIHDLTEIIETGNKIIKVLDEIDDIQKAYKIKRTKIILFYSILIFLQLLVIIFYVG